MTHSGIFVARQYLDNELTIIVSSLGQFVDYYGETDYTDKIVNAGFDATSITLGGKVFDFSAYDFDPRAGT